MIINERLSLLQQKVHVPKGQTNQFGGYKYRSCEDILEAVKPHLDTATLTLTDDLVLIGTRYYVKATATLTDEGGISVTAYAREEEVKKGMDASQITGACSSYARKYALNGLLLVDDVKDADTMDNTKADGTKSYKLDNPVKGAPKNTEPDVPEDLGQPPKVLKTTPEQKIKIRELMVKNNIVDRAVQKDFYAYVMSSDTPELAADFIDNFDEKLKYYQKTKEIKDDAVDDRPVD